MGSGNLQRSAYTFIYYKVKIWSLTPALFLWDVQKRELLIHASPSIASTRRPDPDPFRFCWFSTSILGAYLVPGAEGDADGVGDVMAVRFAPFLTLFPPASPLSSPLVRLALLYNTPVHRKARTVLRRTGTALELFPTNTIIMSENERSRSDTLRAFYIIRTPPDLAREKSEPLSAGIREPLIIQPKPKDIKRGIMKSITDTRHERMSPGNNIDPCNLSMSQRRCHGNRLDLAVFVRCNEGPRCDWKTRTVSKGDSQHFHTRVSHYQEPGDGCTSPLMDSRDS
ncbi:hypothetical protein Baya_12825 [Bagarius yarrelli]|uniref:Uncharacterized protein n=1 Tax=Bagarius yarrelli TaxID=175774 RepID=A0A556V4J8_BAGYA|nr:hypothetical protein Baya_12825 [Bagarius yarrelli]